MALQLRNILPYNPSEFLKGEIGEWVLVILLCSLFMALAGTVLPRRLTEKRSGKALTVCLGLILGLGLYQGRHLFNFNLESFGLVGLFLTLILLGFLTYGLSRLGFDKSTAFALTYCLLYFGMSSLDPSPFDLIAKTIPILNLILLILFLYLAGKMLFKAFGGTKDFNISLKRLKHEHMEPEGEPEIEKEAKAQELEAREIKKTSIHLTHKELHTVEGIDGLLSDIMIEIRRHPHLNDADKQVLSKQLSRLRALKDYFGRRILVLRNQIKNYQTSDERTIQELRHRYETCKNKKQKNQIYKEYKLEKAKLELFDFIFQNEKRIGYEMSKFEQNIALGVDSLRQNNTPQAIVYLSAARNTLHDVEKDIRKLIKLEKMLLKKTKKEKRELEREKKN